MERRDDAIWRALASPVRRGILDSLRERRRLTGELCALHPGLSRYAVMQHLGVLEEAGLVLAHREGRKRWNSLNAAPLLEVLERWITPYEAIWAGRLLGIRRRVEAAGQGRSDRPGGEKETRESRRKKRGGRDR